MNITRTLYDIGNNGPFFLFFTSFYLLWTKERLFFYYIIGFFISIILNMLLKAIVKQPRPSVDSSVFYLLKNSKKIMNIPYDMFGMPSGHTQSCCFSTVFIFLSLKKYSMLFWYLLLTFITTYQRVKYKFHTTLQVIIGGIVGILLGFIIYYISQNNIKGNLKLKRDDNNLIK